MEGVYPPSTVCQSQAIQFLMPFVGKDWRSSGDLWIKTPNGWRKAALLRQKLFENLTQSILLRFFRKHMTDECSDVTFPALNQHPQVFLNKLGTRKVIAELDEALELLDLTSSVHDLRRVQFVIALSRLLIDKFSELSVQAQKTVICILGELVSHCERTKMDTPAVRRLVFSLEKTLCSSRFLQMGSSATAAIRNNSLLCYRSRLNVCPNQCSAFNIMDLPEDCLMAITYRLVDPYDVVRLGATCKKFNIVCANQHLWRSLYELYLTDGDIKRFRTSVLPTQDSSVTAKVDWRYCCLRFYRPYRLQRTYADQPRLCQSCWCVFWRGSGHQCALRSKDISYDGKDVTPGDLLQLLIAG